MLGLQTMGWSNVVRQSNSFFSVWSTASQQIHKENSEKYFACLSLWPALNIPYCSKASQCIVFFLFNNSSIRIFSIKGEGIMFQQQRLSLLMFGFHDKMFWFDSNYCMLPVFGHLFMFTLMHKCHVFPWDHFSQDSRVCLVSLWWISCPFKPNINNYLQRRWVFIQFNFIVEDKNPETTLEM